MEYRSINGREVHAEVLRDIAYAAEQEAYVEELEVGRQARLAQKLRGERYGEVRAQAKRTSEERSIRARELRRTADKLAIEAGLALPEVMTIRRGIVDAWVQGLEREHLGHSVRLKALSGHSRATQEERLQLEDWLAILELSHSFGCEQLDQTEIATPSVELNLHDLSVEELRDLASELKIPGRSHLKTKDALIEAIQKVTRQHPSKD